MTGVYLASSLPVGILFGLGVRNVAALPHADVEPILTGAVMVAFVVASCAVLCIDGWGRE